MCNNYSLMQQLPLIQELSLLCKFFNILFNVSACSHNLVQLSLSHSIACSSISCFDMTFGHQPISTCHSDCTSYANDCTWKLCWPIHSPRAVAERAEVLKSEKCKTFLVAGASHTLRFVKDRKMDQNSDKRA